MECQTEYCIDSAVRTAKINIFDVTLVADGHSTKDSTVLPAEQIISHHNKTLHGHDNVHHFSLVRNSKDNLYIDLFRDQLN